MAQLEWVSERAGFFGSTDGRFVLVRVWNWHLFDRGVHVATCSTILHAQHAAEKLARIGRPIQQQLPSIPPDRGERR